MVYNKILVSLKEILDYIQGMKYMLKHIVVAVEKL
jgi:hypothetical protein